MIDIHRLTAEDTKDWDLPGRWRLTLTTTVTEAHYLTREAQSARVLDGVCPFGAPTAGFPFVMYEMPHVEGRNGIQTSTVQHVKIDSDLGYTFKTKNSTYTLEKLP